MQENTTFTGLLECPFREGFIEFEYHNGDTVADLIIQVENVWGEIEQDRILLNQKKRLSEISSSGWIIACEDAHEAYRILQLTDLIPITKKAPNEIIDPSYMVYGRHIESDGMLDIFSFAQVKYRSGHYFHPELGEFNYTTDPENFNKHIKITLNRAYKLPKKSFDIRLIAIVAIAGG